MRHLEQAAGTPDADLEASDRTIVGCVGEEPVSRLVERARKGSPEAWEALYRRSFPRLLAYARRRLPSEEHARDAVSEAMVRAVSSLERFANEGAGFDAWLYGILRHVVLDTQRRLWREVPTETPAPNLAVAHDSTAADLVFDRDDACRLRSAFVRLSALEQEILELRVVAGLSAEAVASVVGRRPGAVRMAQARALARLRKHLSEEGWDVA